MEMRSRKEIQQAIRMRKRAKRKKTLRFSMAVILFIVMIYGGYEWWDRTKANQQIDNQTAEARIETEPQQNEVDQNEADQNETDQNEADQNKTDQNETDQNEALPNEASQDEELDEEQDMPAKKEIRMSFVGDILFGGNVAPLLEQHGYDYPYRYVVPFLKEPDLTIGNLETPITQRGEPEEKQWAYRGSPSALPALKEAGFDVMNLANNHILDYGEIGLLDTFTYMDDNEIAYIGAGKNADEAYRHIVFERNGIKVAFLGFSRVVPNGEWKARNASEQEPNGHPGVAETYDYRRPIEAIERAKQDADLVVVIAHWGEERKDTPLDNQVELAHRYIDAGADLIVGGHAHVLQSFEHYEGKWIAYGLGNFIFTTNEVEKTRDTVIMEATCSSEGECEISLVPIYTIWAQPKEMDKQQARALFKRLDDLSIQASVNEDGQLVAKDE